MPGELTSVINAASFSRYAPGKCAEVGECTILPNKGAIDETVRGVGTRRLPFVIDCYWCGRGCGANPSMVPMSITSSLSQSKARPAEKSQVAAV